MESNRNSGQGKDKKKNDGDTCTPLCEKKFKTGEDNSTFFSIKVLQGDERLVEDNHLIAESKLHGIEPAPAGEQKVEVTYRVNEEGLLTVSAKSFSDPN